MCILFLFFIHYYCYGALYFIQCQYHRTTLVTNQELYQYMKALTELIMSEINLVW